jgi:3-phenylpropionate/trans-cinnamate dioxygenase ferredoxin reductase subunit
VRHVVVVGGGLAGHRALQELASHAVRVTLVGDEAHPPYDRPPLSKQVLLGELEPGATRLDAGGLDVDWRLASAAVGLDAERHVVRLAGGGELAYDGLVVATGRRARAWPALPALDGFHVLRSLGDAVRLRAAVHAGRRVAIVGAGFIGCEVAASLRRQGVGEVTLIDVAAQPMAPLGAAAGAAARRLHEAHGVRFRLGAQVTGFDGRGGRVSAVRLRDDAPVPADLVLLALGSEPNTEWLHGSGVELRRGAVACDEHCFARGVQDVVAAGDVAAWAHPHAPEADGLVCVEHWSTAREMGRVAARNLVAGADGDRTPFATVPTFWSDQYDVKIKSVGLLAAADRFAVVEDDPGQRRLVVEALRGDELVGAVVFNRNKALTGYHRRLKDALAAGAPAGVRA